MVTANDNLNGAKGGQLQPPTTVNGIQNGSTRNLNILSRAPTNAKMAREVIPMQKSEAHPHTPGKKKEKEPVLQGEHHENKFVMGAFSASNHKQLRKFAEIKAIPQGHVVFTSREGVVREEGEFDRLEREEAFRLGSRKMREFMEHHTGYTEHALNKLDAMRNGRLTRLEFEDVLLTLHTGLSRYQLKTMTSHFIDPELDMVNYEAFLKEYRNLRPQSSFAKKKKKTLAPPSHLPGLQEKSLEQGEVMPEVIFVAGFCFPPLWCAGWYWFNSNFVATKRLARASVLLSTLAFIAGIVLLAIYITQRDTPRSTPSHCRQIVGALAVLKLRGSRATKEFFWDGSDRFLRVTTLKKGLYSLYLQRTSDRNRMEEEAVYIDEIEDIEGDPEGFTAYIQFRMVTADLREAQEFTGYIQEWVDTGLLEQTLSELNLPFEQLKLDVLDVPSSIFDVQTPTVFEQSRQQLLLATSHWFSSPALPVLMMQTPQRGNPLDFDNPEWQFHEAQYLPTCWWGMLYTLSADPCVTDSTVSCADVGAAEGERLIQLQVMSNSSEELLSVFVRQLYGEVTGGEELPMPTWMQDRSEALAATPLRDPNRCGSSNNERSCMWNYELNIAKGPFRSSYWIGVVGQNRRGSKVPFSVNTRFQNFNTITPGSNPFVDLVLGDNTVGSAGRRRSCWAVTALAVMLLLVGSARR